MSRNISADMVDECRRCAAWLRYEATQQSPADRHTAKMEKLAFAVEWLINDHAAVSAGVDQADRMYEAAANLATSHERQLVEIAGIVGRDARGVGTIAAAVAEEWAKLKADLNAAAGAARYEGEWSAHNSEQYDELRAAVTTSLQQLDELAELWGDEGKFRAARDRLRKSLGAGDAQG